MENLLKSNIYYIEQLEYNYEHVELRNDPPIEKLEIWEFNMDKSPLVYLIMIVGLDWKSRR
jgi:hypothetical protein